jgi:hypothetical protein
MRERQQTKQLSVHAIAGTDVVLLGLDAAPEVMKKLLGFEVRRTDSRTQKWLAGGRTFRGAGSDGEKADSRSAPIQAFLWGDYEARPGTTYTNHVTAKYGRPEVPTDGESITIRVTTEDPDDGTHGVFFNLGVAGSQAYSRLVGEYRRFYLVEKLGRETWKDFIRPDEIPSRQAWKWLSRGLEEALLSFIRQAKSSRYGLRAAVYCHSAATGPSRFSCRARRTKA